MQLEFSGAGGRQGSQPYRGKAGRACLFNHFNLPGGPKRKEPPFLLSPKERNRQKPTIRTGTSSQTRLSPFPDDIIFRTADVERWNFPIQLARFIIGSASQIRQHPIAIVDMTIMEIDDERTLNFIVANTG